MSSHSGSGGGAGSSAGGAKGGSSWGGSSGSSGGNATAGKAGAAGGGGGPSGANAKAYAARTDANLMQMEYYAAALCGIMAVFILLHLIRIGANKVGLANKAISAPFVGVTRLVRNVFLRKVALLPSAGHLVLALVYIGINATIAFTNLDNTVLALHSNLASRFGWMAISNVALTVFLSLKNTPLAYVSAWSYERLNWLHQIAGYTTFTFIVLHSCSYTSYFGQKGMWDKLRAYEEIFGIAAGFGCLVMVLAATVIRFFWYELFYIMHVTFFIGTITCIGMHQPHISKKILIITLLAASMWFVDRCVRLVRVSLFTVNNQVCLEALPSGGTRIKLKKAPKWSTSATHCFLWIPAIRRFEMHPFTIVTTEKGTHEFVVNSYDGFTRDLHKFSQQNPGKWIRCSVEGPYGTFPSPLDYDKVVMIAGGSGGSFTFGNALRVLQQWPEGKHMEFHWIVKERSYFAWFAHIIHIIHTSTKAKVILHVTRELREESPRLHLRHVHSMSSSDGGLSPINEKPVVRFSTPPQSPRPEDPEKAAGNSDIFAPLGDDSSDDGEVYAHGCYGGCGAHAVCCLHDIEIRTGRPNVPSIIREAIANTPRKERVLVMGCGPKMLMREIRDTTASCIRPRGPCVELHTEQFGW